MPSCVHAVFFLCEIFSLKKSRGGGSIVNIDLQFINSGTHFSKCQATFNTIVSGLFFAFRQKQSDCSLVKSRQREKKKKDTSQSLHLHSWLKIIQSMDAFVKCLETGRRLGWRSGTVSSYGCMNFCSLMMGTWLSRCAAGLVYKWKLSAEILAGFYKKSCSCVRQCHGLNATWHGM